MTRSQEGNPTAFVGGLLAVQHGLHADTPEHGGAMLERHTRLQAAKLQAERFFTMSLIVLP